MTLLDRGPESVRVFPSIRQRDDRGNWQRVPGPDPVPLEHVWIFPAESVESATQQTLLTRFSLLCTEFPGGAWSMVEWNGDEFDVIGDPAPVKSPTGRATNTTVVLQARKPKAVRDG